jgi:hypothetical protein
MAYRSADAMLERYLVLWSELGAARALTLPDPRMPRFKFVAVDPRNSKQDRQLVEVGDIGRCIRLARLTVVERRLFFEIYRPRGRVCRRCRHETPTAYPRCPKCRATRADGWTHEALPTLPVLAQAMEKATRERWSTERVRRARDRAYDRLEAVMRRRGLLDDDGAAEAAR